MAFSHRFAPCFGIAGQLYSSTLLRKVSLGRPRKDGGNLISVVLWSLNQPLKESLSMLFQFSSVPRVRFTLSNRGPNSLDYSA